MASTLSMTGYGRCEVAGRNLTIAVEIRAVNHRFLDVQMKLPRGLLLLERELTRRIKERVGRGRLDVFVHRDARGDAQQQVRLDEGLVAQLLREAARVIGPAPGGVVVSHDVSLAALLAIPGVIVVREAEADPEAEGPRALSALDGALDALLAMRRTEGLALESDLRARLLQVGVITEQIGTLAATLPALFRDRVERRLRDLLGAVSVDPILVLTEAALVASRSDVSEELTRLRAHVAHGLALFGQDGPVGRPLEFLVQELGREANTVGSKSDDARVSALVVVLKGEIEKIREQVANVE